MKRDKNQKTEVSKFNPVPLHRSYGVKKKEYEAIEILKMWLERIIAVLLLLVPATALAVGLIAVMLYSSPLMKVIFWLVASIFVFLAFTKTTRNRLKFNKKLKRFCKRENFDLRIERDFWKSLKWSDDKCDFTVETPSRLYYVHVLNVKKARQKILFESESKIKLITPPPRNRFSIIFNPKTKVQALSIDFSEAKSFEKKEAAKIILILPGCLNISYRQSNVSIIPTGNGGEHFGYTIFTAKGFMNFLPRYEENLRMKK